MVEMIQAAKAVAAWRKHGGSVLLARPKADRLEPIPGRQRQFDESVYQTGAKSPRDIEQLFRSAPGSAFIVIIDDGRQSGIPTLAVSYGPDDPVKSIGLTIDVAPKSNKPVREEATPKSAMASDEEALRMNYQAVSAELDRLRTSKAEVMLRISKAGSADVKHASAKGLTEELIARRTQLRAQSFTGENEAADTSDIDQAIAEAERDEASASDEAEAAQFALVDLRKVRVDLEKKIEEAQASCAKLRARWAKSRQLQIMETLKTNLEGLSGTLAELRAADEMLADTSLSHLCRADHVLGKLKEPFFGSTGLDKSVQPSWAGCRKAKDLPGVDAAYARLVAKLESSE